MLTFFCIMYVLSCGFELASKVTPYDEEDYICPSKRYPHTNRQDRNDSNNT